MVFVEKVTTGYGQKYCYMTADMQLYKLIMQVKWSNPKRWENLIVQPGGMHTVMSFIGCIGNLMKGSGLEEILHAAYKGISSMVNGKAWPKALRGFRMIIAAMLEDIISDGNTSVEDIEDALNQACVTPTG